MAFWLCLTFHGARVGGQRDWRHLSCVESLCPSEAPADAGWPDSLAGRRRSKQVQEALVEEHFKSVRLNLLHCVVGSYTIVRYRFK